MTEPNPYTDGEYKWGPTPPAGTPGAPDTGGAPQYDFPQPTLADGQVPPPAPGYGYPNDGQVPPPPGYGYPSDGYPNGTPAYGYPHPAEQAPMASGTPLVSIGDITVVGDSIVTPSGTLPLRGAVWNATDMSRTEEKIPTHAIILAIVFFLFCLLGLLFLLMKERTTTGFIQVTVTSGGRHHSTMVPATNPMAFQIIMGQIGYARSLSAM